MNAIDLDPVGIQALAFHHLRYDPIDKLNLRIEPISSDRLLYKMLREI
jgi:hypothetical protein